MTIEHVISGRARDVDGFSVRRLLPAAARQMVGPFIFLDHIGPAGLAPGAGLDVRPHPHIALATVTYLYSGSLMHRDSLGFVQEIRPGDVNWMTAGRGIVHSERSPQGERARGARLHGVQSWVALPDGHEDDEPAFHHHSAATLPTLSAKGVELRVIAGEAFGRRSPVATVWPTLYVDAAMPAETSIDLPPDYTDRAIYVAEGEIELFGDRYGPGQLVILETGEDVPIRAMHTSRLMLLGGERFPTPRLIWWNFVSSTRERMEQAKRDWAEQRFARVPGESEFIPLPEH
ncbi:MAG: pirin family protein [Gammaproteobacteria bacterium]